ncbi:ATP-binding response regulator [Fulvivirga ligni]|uniref:ATP-binding response regulator n=1 Tax=Fulvivirga ligni TaxID=2904246 RepID=UPI001F2D7BB8|nr:ATP-binding protein [Fulvivirga ligni]UII20697.1 ATP-binding protein [Fulvivirga ligni]
MKDLNILVVEDSKDDFLLMERVLRKNNINCSLRCIDGREEFMRSIDKDTPDLIISDHALADFSSIDALKMCREKDKNVPFILVTGALPEEAARSLMFVGIDNYVLKKDLHLLPDVVITTMTKYWHWTQHASEVGGVNATKQATRGFSLFSLQYNEYLDSKLATINDVIKTAETLEEERQMENIHIQSLKIHVNEIRRVACSIKDLYELKLSEVSARQVLLKPFISIVWEKVMKEYNMNLTLINDIPDVITWTGKVGYLEVILMHILKNCILYKDERKELNKVAVSAESEENQLVIHIRDNGLGIETENLSKLFDMFYTSSTTFRTAGVGLYIVKELVSEIGSEIKISSRIHEGTHIELSLPC